MSKENGKVKVIDTLRSSGNEGKLIKLNKKVCRAVGFTTDKQGRWIDPRGKVVPELPRYVMNDMLAWGALVDYCTKRIDGAFNIYGDGEKMLVTIMNKAHTKERGKGVNGEDYYFATAVCIAIYEDYTYGLQKQSKRKI